MDAPGTTRRQWIGLGLLFLVIVAAVIIVVEMLTGMVSQSCCTGV